MAKLKIAFIWDWEPSYEQTVTWKDGLAAAMRELGTRHDVRMFTDCPYPIQHPWFTFYPIDGAREWDPDVFLHWADMTRPHAIEHFQYGKPMAICFAGGEPMHDNTELFDHIFCESQVYLKRFQEQGYSASIAFGTNTELFAPEPRQRRVFDVLFPATYAKWKRHDLLAAATKDLRVCTAGYMYPGTWESECYEVMQDASALVLPHVSAETLRALYAASGCVVIPSRSDGGSQRTVLEALSMNVPVVVTDSDKFDYPGVYRVKPEAGAIRAMLAQLANHTPVNTRAAIIADWSHVTYARAIERELLRLCQVSVS